MPLEGQNLGHYRLLRLLGSGGMGEVYLAEDVRIGQQVAIKVVRSDGITYPQSESAQEAARLFEREARAIARLDHPHILPLYAYGEEMLNGMLLTYLVMPYRKEGTLAHWLRQHNGGAWLSPARIDLLLYQAADALQHAHDQHVLHQDIKPSNFLIRLRSDHPDQPDLLLADFGIAKLTGATASASQSIRGTPIYMAPEQWDGQSVPASDQYALAIMVYELLIGRPPFVGNPAQVMRQHYMTHPPAPSSLNARLSPAIDSVLLRALSKQPEERFASVTAFARAFHEALNSEVELRATLAISQAEATSGTTRSLTLPGGRQVSVTVPAGASDGSTLRLEGQGMPYYEGGPLGPLVLTIVISSEVDSLFHSQDSTDPTVAMTTPDIDLPVDEGQALFPAHPQAPSELGPTQLASHDSGTASTVLATDSAQQVAAIPAGPKVGTSWISTIITTLIGITIFGVTTYVSDLIYLDIYSNSSLSNSIIPGWDGSTSWLALIFGWYLVVPLFFGARFGPWVGLCTAVIGSFLGDVISGYLASNGIVWYGYIGIAACGFFPGLAYRHSRGRNLSIRAALLFSLLGMSIYYIIGAFGDSITKNQWIWGNSFQYAITYLFQQVITLMLASLPALLLLIIALFISNALGKNRISA